MNNLSVTPMLVTHYLIKNIIAVYLTESQYYNIKKCDKGVQHSFVLTLFSYELENVLYSFFCFFRIFYSKLLMFCQLDRLFLEPVIRKT